MHHIVHTAAASLGRLCERANARRIESDGGSKKKTQTQTQTQTQEGDAGKASHKPETNDSDSSRQDPSHGGEGSVIAKQEGSTDLSLSSAMVKSDADSLLKELEDEVKHRRYILVQWLGHVCPMFEHMYSCPISPHLPALLPQLLQVCVFPYKYTWRCVCERV
jgi:hypothetical protein